MDKSWINLRHPDAGFIKGMYAFIDFAQNHLPDTGTITYPFRDGFTETYKVWYAHGEKEIHEDIEHVELFEQHQNEIFMDDSGNNIGNPVIPDNGDMINSILEGGVANVSSEYQEPSEDDSTAELKKNRLEAMTTLYPGCEETLTYCAEYKGLGNSNILTKLEKSLDRSLSAPPDLLNVVDYNENDDEGRPVGSSQEFIIEGIEYEQARMWVLNSQPCYNSWKREHDNFIKLHKLAMGKRSGQYKIPSEEEFIPWFKNACNPIQKRKMIQDIEKSISYSDRGSRYSLFALDTQEKQSQCSPTIMNHCSTDVTDNESSDVMRNIPGHLSDDLTTNNIKGKCDESEDDSSVDAKSDVDMKECVQHQDDHNIKSGCRENSKLDMNGKHFEGKAVHFSSKTSSAMHVPDLRSLNGDSEKQQMPGVTCNIMAPKVPQMVGDTTSGTPTKASRSSVSNSDDFDEKGKLSVVQQRGRFKVTSENIALKKGIPSPMLQKSHSLQWTVPKPATCKWLKPPTNCYALNTDGSLGATGGVELFLGAGKCCRLHWTILAKEDQTAAVISDPMQADHLQTQVANGRNGIDVDKFDYIVRDSRACGLGCNFQFQRQLENSTVRFLVKLMETMRVMGDEICFRAKDSSGVTLKEEDLAVCNVKINLIHGRQNPLERVKNFKDYDSWEMFSIADNRTSHLLPICNEDMIVRVYSKKHELVEVISEAFENF
ncbi:hypothetical protein GIB67_008133 [Kingdonia uniflora]|uniref:Uncharacterized protein n=1 Tax=Kingdonia uniflora TaxID=39325 RepID=A0A7J7MT35_9MAGN|nr:hypothetical protein GIB67_008133 [Kingdonia uniflora]